MKKPKIPKGYRKLKKGEYFNESSICYSHKYNYYFKSCFSLSKETKYDGSGFYITKKK